jgi:hypothetical protein
MTLAKDRKSISSSSLSVATTAELATECEELSQREFAFRSGLDPLLPRVTEGEDATGRILGFEIGENMLICFGI